jgi:hypothetical protein
VRRRKLSKRRRRPRTTRLASGRSRRSRRRRSPTRRRHLRPRRRTKSSSPISARGAQPRRHLDCYGLCPCDNVRHIRKLVPPGQSVHLHAGSVWVWNDHRLGYAPAHRRFDSSVAQAFRAAPRCTAPRHSATAAPTVPQCVLPPLRLRAQGRPGAFPTELEALRCWV